MVAARPLHLIHGGASLTYAAGSPISLAGLARPDLRMACVMDSPLRTCREVPAIPPADPAAGQAVDQTVDSAVDSHLSRGITRAFLWISRSSEKILKFLTRKPCASSPERSTNSFTARAEVLPGGNPRDAGETRAIGKPATGISVAASRLGGGPQSARKPATGNRRDAPGSGPPTHTEGPHCIPPLQPGRRPALVAPAPPAHISRTVHRTGQNALPSAPDT